jgi:hypothetical protein
LENLKKTDVKQQPKRVILFSGHMIDKADRKEPRFPADKEPIAAKAIADKLDHMKVGSDDLAMCGGACGGDLIFAKASLDRGLKLEIRIPFPEPIFLEESVNFAGDKWRDLYYEVKNHPNTDLYIMPGELGPTPEKMNPYERNNLWQLHTAMSYGSEKVRFICLWNRKGGDGPGGTKHMHDTVLEHSGQVYVLDTNILW